ncbi:hypothetical protein Tco_0953335 [Tanacetum coccineum]|uniref:Uncharacterized protein n=1 Tax=Tanacetum coccineum TaxID=301880 RepID=A0ABQ5DZR4_9ASTR
MSTLMFVDPESSTQADGAQSSRVPGEEFVVVEPSGTRSDSFHSSASSDSTAPLSPDHPLTRTSPTPTPTRASFNRRTTRMTVRAQPVMSYGYSARVTEVMALSDSAFRKSEEDEIGEEDADEDGGDESSDADDEGHELKDESHKLDDEGHGLYSEDRGLDDEGHSIERDGLGLEEEEEVVPRGQQRAVLVVEIAASEPLGLGYGALRRRELAAEEDQIRSTFEVGHGSGSVLKPERPKRVLVRRQPTLTTWTDPEDGRVYIDIPTYPPPAPPVQTPPSPEWSSGSLLVSPAPSAFPSPVSSPLISLTVPSPIASLVATPTATIPVDEDQFTEIDRDVRELYTRSWAVRDEIFSQRYRLRSLEHEQERTAMTFGALWRLVLAFEAWAERVDTRMAGMSQAGYDDHRLIHDMLVQQAALQRELQEMRGRVTALEKERDRS